MKKFLLEICVDSFESARRAAENGADRLELCSDLLVGGLSPSPFLIEQVVSRIAALVNVLLRPRFGDFCFTDEERRSSCGRSNSVRKMASTAWSSAR